MGPLKLFFIYVTNVFYFKHFYLSSSFGFDFLGWYSPSLCGLPDGLVNVLANLSASVSLCTCILENLSLQYICLWYLLLFVICWLVSMVVVVDMREVLYCLAFASFLGRPYDQPLEIELSWWSCPFPRVEDIEWSWPHIVSFPPIIMGSFTFSLPPAEMNLHLYPGGKSDCCPFTGSLSICSLEERKLGRILCFSQSSGFSPV